MNGHAREVATWAAGSAFFGSLIGLKLLERISGEDWAQILGAVIVAGVAAGAAYSKERLTAAKRLRNGAGEG